MSKAQRGKRPARRGAAGHWLPRVEWGSAILLTLLALVFHAGFMAHAGALWRDEVNSVEYATMSSLPSIYDSLRYDGFPILSTLLLRGWAGIGLGQSDWGFRLFGLVIGVAFLGTLWIACRILGCPSPLLSLALVGLSPWAIRTADSVRPYGLGMLLIVLTLGLLWRAMESPTAKRFLAAGAAALLSVQCMYQNAFLLLAIGLAAGIVALRDSQPRKAIGVGLVGLAAAVSLLVYAPSISAARSWNVVAQTPSTTKQMLTVLFDALGSGGAVRTWLWLGSAALCCAGGIQALRKRTKPLPPKGRPSPAFFAAAVLVAATIVFLAAIKITRLPMQPWYYVPLAAVLAPMLEAGVWVAATNNARRIGRFALVLVTAGATALPGWSQVTERRTNVEAVASFLGKQASAGDAIVVYPFYFGVSFHRYYRGTSTWTTLPPMEDVRIHRYDLLKAAMARPHPIDPVLAAMSRSLMSGHRVWLVGGLPAPRMDQPAPSIPPAPHPAYGWFGGPYIATWGQQAAHFLSSHALQIENLPAPGGSPVSPYEDIPLAVAWGWR